MRRLLLLLVVFFTAAPCSAQFWAGRDAYGGISGKPCGHTATGFFFPATFAAHNGLFCDPLGNLYEPVGMYVVDRTAGGSTDDAGHVYNTVILAKYGSAPAWADATINRLMQWGFNALFTNEAAGVLPEATDASYPLDGNGLHSIPHKMPHESQVNGGLYSMKNNLWNLSEPLKNSFTAKSPRYAALSGFVNSNGFPDYSNTVPLAVEVLAELQVSGASSTFQTIRNSIYNPYMFGVANGDSDYDWFFGATGADVFATNPAGHNADHGGWFAITASPLISADNGAYPGLYQDNVLYIKKRAYSYLLAKYGANPTVAGGTSGVALNAAWGSSYGTTLGTSGTCFGSYYFPCATTNATETYDTADGVKTSFSHTLSGTNVAPLSVQILAANGAVVAGDNGAGVIYGACITGTVTYSTGVSSFSWAATCTGARTLQRIVGVGGTVTMVYGVTNGNKQTGCVVGEGITVAGTTNYNGTYAITACGNSGGPFVGGSSANGYTIQFAKAGTIAQETAGTFVLPTLSSQTLKAQYISGGWQSGTPGTGFLDEDGRSGHSSYVGTNPGNAGLNGSANFNADADQILFLISTDYFKTFSDQIRTVFPNHMRGGPDSLGTWSIPSRCVVLQAAAPYVDYIMSGGEVNFTVAMLDYVHNCLGDKPVIQGQYRTADVQSALSFPNSTATRSGSTVTVTTSRNNNATTSKVVAMTGCSDTTFNSTGTPHAVTAATLTTIQFTLAGAGTTATGCNLYYDDSNVGGFASQAARGASYSTTLAGLFSLSNSFGVFPTGGVAWWQFTDQWSENLDWGLVTVQDNAYDGNEDVTATSVTCSAPLNSFTTCGGEVANFGDLITTVKAANQALDNAIGALPNPPTTSPSTIILSCLFLGLMARIIKENLRKVP